MDCGRELIGVRHPAVVNATARFDDLPQHEEVARDTFLFALVTPDSQNPFFISRHRERALPCLIADDVYVKLLGRLRLGSAASSSLDGTLGYSLQRDFHALDTIAVGTGSVAARGNGDRRFQRIANFRAASLGGACPCLDNSHGAFKVGAVIDPAYAQVDHFQDVAALVGWRQRGGAARHQYNGRLRTVGQRDGYRQFGAVARLTLVDDLHFNDQIRQHSDGAQGACDGAELINALHPAATAARIERQFKLSIDP